MYRVQSLVELIQSIQDFSQVLQILTSLTARTPMLLFPQSTIADLHNNNVAATQKQELQTLNTQLQQKIVLTEQP